MHSQEEPSAAANAESGVTEPAAESAPQVVLPVISPYGTRRRGERAAKALAAAPASKEATPEAR